MYNPFLPRGYSETAAVIRVEASEVERQNVDDPAIDDQELVVVPHEIAGGPRRGDTGGEQPHFEFTQVLLARRFWPARRARLLPHHERRPLQRRLDLGPIAPEDGIPSSG